MEDGRWERYGALGGVGFVLLAVPPGLLGGEPPGPELSAAETVAYLTEHAAAVKAGLWLFGLGAIALMWWFGSLWRRMERVERTPRLAVVSLLGLATAGALSLVASAVWVAMVLRIGELGTSARFLNMLGWVVWSASSFGLAAHLLATNALALRTGMLRTWLLVCGGVSAAAFLVSAVVGSVRPGSLSDGASLLGFVLYCVWVLGVSWRIWSDGAPSVAVPDAVLARSAS